MHLLLFSLFSYFTSLAPGIELTGYFSCAGSLLEETGDALSIYARTQRTCNKGEVILAAEKRLSSRAQKAVFTITDTLHLHLSANMQLAIARCTTTSGKTHQYFVLSRGTTASERQYLSNIKRVWGVNAQHRLVPVPVKTVKCLNNDYGV